MTRIRTLGRVRAGALLALLIPLSLSCATQAYGSSIPDFQNGQVSRVQSLQTKYRYFLRNDALVVKALLLTRCNPPSFSFNVDDRGGDLPIWVTQTKFYRDSFGNSIHPVIEYVKAKTSTDSFVLRGGGESDLWWKKKWGCPLDTHPEGWHRVAMTTQQLVSAGY